MSSFTGITGDARVTRARFMFSSTPTNQATMRKRLTLKDALDVQKFQLENMKTVLKPEVYEKVAECVQLKTKEAKFHEDVIRGEALWLLVFYSFVPKR